MDSTRVLVAALVGVLVIAGFGLFLVADTADRRTVNVERNPVVPDRPTPLNATSAAAYVDTYEERRLYRGNKASASGLDPEAVHNALLASRNHTLGVEERVVSDCGNASVTERDAGECRVRLRCRGGIDDPSGRNDPDRFSYSVAYRVTGNGTEQVEIRGYPLGDRPDLG